MIRRLPRSVLALHAAFFAAGMLPCLTARAADWLQARGSQAHTALAPGAPNGILVPLWSVRFPTVTSGTETFPPAVSSSPAIVNGVVYVGSRNTHVYALDARTGATVWDYAAGSPVEASPLVANGKVVFEPYNGTLTALDATTGTVVWTHASGGLQDRSSPNLSNGNVVSGATYPEHTIYAVPADSTGTATRAWTFTTGYDDTAHAYDPTKGQFVFSSPAVDPATGNVFCGANDGRLYGLKPDGTPLWAQPFSTSGSIFRAAPSLANGKVYLSGGDYDWALHAVDAATGAKVWDAPMLPAPTWPDYVYRGIQVSSPAVDGDFISIVGGYGNNLGPSTLYAFKDAGTAASLLWSVSIPNAVSGDYVSSPALTPSSVLVGAAAAADPSHPTYPTGRLYMVDRATGEARWYAAGTPEMSGGPIFSSPAVANDLVVVGDNSGAVTAYRIAKPGDADEDGVVTARDVVKAMAATSTDGQAPASIMLRADISPANTVPASGLRSFGDGLVTPEDLDRILQYAVGLRPSLP